MTHEKYAVVIVTYNRESLLRECIHQVNQQTVPAQKIIIVNNASTDGTHIYLKSLASDTDIYQIIECKKNVGGAGGFAKGIEQALRYEPDYVLIIDDDAMLCPDYMEKLFRAKSEHPMYRAFAGCVKSQEKIDIYHRRRLSKIGLFFRNCPESMYQHDYFKCEIASFCGMVLERELIRRIGLPHSEYFIWNDDAEYSLRVHKYSDFLVVPDAVLHHKIKTENHKNFPRRYEWRDYYGIRNRILLVKEHGNPADQLVNGIDLFVRVILRNLIFSFIKKNGYDWKYEREISRAAIRDARYGITRTG